MEGAPSTRQVPIRRSRSERNPVLPGRRLTASSSGRGYSIDERQKLNDSGRFTYQEPSGRPMVWRHRRRCILYERKNNQLSPAPTQTTTRRCFEINLPFVKRRGRVEAKRPRRGCPTKKAHNNNDQNLNTSPNTNHPTLPTTSTGVSTRLTSPEIFIHNHLLAETFIHESPFTKANASP